ncbi:hypothetical protein BKI52_33530 [marine bacterium AO1-C]|nr:hypothetical protein BKI52_33530 [marine bacterium AO1-C]
MNQKLSLLLIGLVSLVLVQACGSIGSKTEGIQEVRTVDTTLTDTTQQITENKPPVINDMKKHNTEVATCVTKYRRSPINITTPGEQKEHSLKFKYVSAHEVVENLGHTVKLLYDKGSELTFDGKNYRLVQFHFHTPAEHRINADEFPMEMYLVHRGADSTYLVVSLLFNEGEENSFLKSFISDIPKKTVETTESKKEIDLTNLFPKDERFYTYAGSLTNPPYTEGVRWVIFRQPVTCSKAQVEVFKKIGGFNARNLQPMNLRKIEEF